MSLLYVFYGAKAMLYEKEKRACENEGRRVLRNIGRIPCVNTSYDHECLRNFGLSVFSKGWEEAKKHFGIK